MKRKVVRRLTHYLKTLKPARATGVFHKGGSGLRGDCRLDFPTIPACSKNSGREPTKANPRNWLRFRTKHPGHAPLALFHTITDMMTVILRIDNNRGSYPSRPSCFDISSISYLLSIHPNLTHRIPVSANVWHIGCPENGCEGLRVLGTWIKPGWGLEIPEIGRTGIFSPRKYLQSGKPLADNPEGFRGK